MSILSELLDSLTGDTPVRSVLVGAHWTCVCSRYGGLATTLKGDLPHGLFSTRYPRRPNPLGISEVNLLAWHDNILEIEGVDVLDGTPLLDIKPYVHDFDVRLGTRSGWYDSRSMK